MSIVGRWCVLGGLLLLLAACGTSPPVRYFGLTATDAGHEGSPPSPVVVGLGPVKLPSYLSRPQIVTRHRSGEFVIDDFRRWAEPLDQNMTRVVAASVESLAPEFTVVAFPHAHVVELQYRIHMLVDRFDTDESGTAVLVVQWGIIGHNGQTLAGPERSRYVARAADATDTRSVVAALNETLADFSAEIAERLQRSHTGGE